MVGSEKARSRAGQTTGTGDEFSIGQLFDVVPDAVIIGEAATGRIAVWNAAAAAMFGYDIGDGPGLLIEDLVRSEMKAAHRAGLERLGRGEPTPLLDSESVVELPAQRKDGTEIWIELRLAHVSGKREGEFALAIIRDITIRREAEAARAAATAELERLRHELEVHNEELDLISRTDHLTGLWNRRHVEEHFAMAISAARRHDRELSLLLLDVDEFKTINTQYGHPIGDAALCEIARRLRESLRTEDTLGRWGGEEFLVVIPDSSCEDALAVAERLRGAVADSLILVEGAGIAVTISVGVATSTYADAAADPGPNVREELLRRADAALSRAKAAGRNRSSI